MAGGGSSWDQRPGALEATRGGHAMAWHDDARGWHVWLRSQYASDVALSAGQARQIAETLRRVADDLCQAADVAEGKHASQVYQ